MRTALGKFALLVTLGAALAACGDAATGGGSAALGELGPMLFGPHATGAPSSHSTAPSSWAQPSLSPASGQRTAASVAGAGSGSTGGRVDVADPAGAFGAPSTSAGAIVNTGEMMRAGAPPPANLDPYVHGYIIEALWNVMEPTQGTLDTSRIDNAVRQVRAWNAANPSNPRGLRMRIFAGFDTPGWALNLGGPAVHLCSQSGSCGYVPRWWTAPVQAAYQQYTQMLANYVNSIPEIREVTVGLTMVRWGEIMVRFPTVAGNQAAYGNAGYTEAGDIAAMKAEIDDSAAFRAVTQIDVADYQTPSNGQDISVSKEIMDYAVATLPHVQFANASITQDPSQNAAIFDLMKTYGPFGSKTATITFQTYPTLSNIPATLARAVSYGACSVELPPGTLDPAVVGPFDAQLRANCAASGVPVPGPA